MSNNFTFTPAEWSRFFYSSSSSSSATDTPLSASTNVTTPQQYPWTGWTDSMSPAELTFSPNGPYEEAPYMHWPIPSPPDLEPLMSNEAVNLLQSYKSPKSTKSDSEDDTPLPESPVDQDPSDTSRKAASHKRRVEQNRAAQRAFRERRRMQAQVLQERINELERENSKLVQNCAGAQAKVAELRHQLECAQRAMFKYYRATNSA